MNCPRCDSSTKTLETRRVPDGAVRRRRECTSCGHRFTTYERAVPESLDVIKRDGRRQPFDREKLRTALVRASHKRDVDPRRLEEIVELVERLGLLLFGSRLFVVALEVLDPVFLELLVLDGGRRAAAPE